MKRVSSSQRSAKSSPPLKNGVRPEAMRSAVQLVAQERQWAKDGTLARLYREGARKRRELTESGN